LKALLALLCLLAAATPAAAQDRIDRLFTEYMARERIPGAVLVVWRDDEVALRRAWGVADRETGSAMSAGALQPIYSVSKQFTAALILRLAAQGRVELDAPVGRYLPEWFADEPALRVRHLLRHTSGLPDFVAMPAARAIEQAAPGLHSPGAILDLVDPLPRRFPPGARHAYSNSNYTALALIAERVSGRPFDRAQRELLLQPLGLDGIDECEALDRSRIVVGHDSEANAVALPVNRAPTHAGNGGLCASADGLARWTRALGEGRVIPPLLLAEMRADEPVSSGPTPPYGFGISLLPLAGRPAYSHAGAGDGWGAWTSYLPEERLTIVILVNRGWFWATDLGVPLVRLLTGAPQPPALRRTRLRARERALLNGEFEDGLFDISLRAQADRLILTNPPFGEPIELWRQPDGRFVAPARPDTFSLRLVNGSIEFDWMEHRSYLVPRRSDVHSR